MNSKSLIYSLGLSGALAITGCSQKSINDSPTHDFVDTTNNQVEKIINPKQTGTTISERLKSISGEKINLSKEISGENEIIYFLYLFNIKNEEAFKKIVGIIQDNYNLKKDYIIGPKTLKIIYLNKYKKEIEKLPKDIQTRLKIFEEMNQYKNKSKTKGDLKIRAGKLPDIFSKDYYYGISTNVNIAGTYINKDLINAVDNKISEKGINAYIYKKYGKTILAVYVEGNLKLLTYVSTGDPHIEGGEYTPLGNFTGKKSNMYYISGAKESIFEEYGEYYGAVMPYAININRGIFAHAGYTSGERESHGCLRLPMLYAEGLYTLLEKYNSKLEEYNSKINWYIRDN